MLSPVKLCNSVDEVLGEGFPGRIVKRFGRSSRRRRLMYPWGTFLKLPVPSAHMFEHIYNQGVHLCCVGVSATSFAPTAATREAVPAVEEKTEFNLVLEEVPTFGRIAMIKAVRTLTALGLKEEKDMIEGLPKKVKEGVSKEDAEGALKTLEAA
jgi:large subunit ribosomal protein L7/L12